MESVQISFCWELKLSPLCFYILHVHTYLLLLIILVLYHQHYLYNVLFHLSILSSDKLWLRQSAEWWHQRLIFQVEQMVLVIIFPQFTEGQIQTWISVKVKSISNRQRFILTYFLMSWEDHNFHLKKLFVPKSSSILQKYSTPWFSGLILLYLPKSYHMKHSNWYEKLKNCNHIGSPTRNTSSDCDKMLRFSYSFTEKISGGHSNAVPEPYCDCMSCSQTPLQTAYLRHT